jgi:ribosomal protein S27AE
MLCERCGAILADGEQERKREYERKTPTGKMRYSVFYSCGECHAKEIESGATEVKPAEGGES